jgi:hypothetical protein
MRSRAVIAAATGAVVLVGAALFAGGGSAQAPGPRTLTFTEADRGSSFRFVDTPPRSRGQSERTLRLSMGDVLVLRNPLVSGTGQRAGTLHATCVATRGGRLGRAFFVCHGAVTLRDGQIAIEVPTRIGDISTGSITGGTGAYNGTRGTFTSREQGPRTIDTFELLP